MELVNELSNLIKKRGSSWNEIEERYKEIYDSLPEEKKNLFVSHSSLYAVCGRTSDVFRSLDILLNILGYRVLWVPKDCDINITLPVKIHKDKDGCVIHYSVNSSSDYEFAESESISSPNREFAEEALSQDFIKRAGRPKGSRNKRKPTVSNVD